MKKGSIIFLSVILTIIISAGVANAFRAGDGTLEVDSLRVGKQDEGGVTFFNGTIVNETTFGTTGNNPVTFGDDVRIDGDIYRGLLGYLGEDTPVKINDNIKIKGPLILDRYNDGGTSISNWENYVVFDESIWVEEDARIDSDLIVGGKSTFVDYIKLPTTFANPSSFDCTCTSNNLTDCGTMIYQPISSEPKLWICGSGGWNSYSPD